ncbi:MAG: tRNA uridine-5-carboxymethylaminomethyl(34) synthesis enzyme MnmG [Planctomycetia bacterium]|nr:tRNA uridine-5-carboxymethylaminomethyl(34) synthesis enzyme MnmG [Planctomycetia bacterium]
MYYDILIVGGGHAGVEAAVAAAKSGARTVLLTANLDTIAAMSCNPAVGGVAKGQIVREVDALGGLMGEVIDQTGIQFRMLNRRKGPAMHGPRAQADKKMYQLVMKERLEQQENLLLRQELVTELIVEEFRDETSEAGHEKRFRVLGVKTQTGVSYLAKKVVLTTGTFLRGILHYGSAQFPGGRSGEPAAILLSESLMRCGIRLERFKTGTPARLHAGTLDYTKFIEHPGDEEPVPFSFLNDRLNVQQISCWMTHTNERVHQIIRENLHFAPMYSGQIVSTGPRYCPSIETKVVRFAEKSQHQIFLEPEGRRTAEVYVNGLSTSLPCDIQEKIIHAISGLEHAEIMRYAYAIEYDYAPSEQLQMSLETKAVEGLYFAGQINGTTGYEEAAGQGLLAGLNAALSLSGKEPLILRRDQAYLGVMVDDLVTRGVDEPYRMFTSRAEHRLRLRGDNADRRLTEIGREYGLVNEERWKKYTEKMTRIQEVTEMIKNHRVEGKTLWELLARPEMSWEMLASYVPELKLFPDTVTQQVTYDAKYSGYLARQDMEVIRQQRLQKLHIPENFDYFSLKQLRMEAKEQLSRICPRTIDQASRIRGITPADLAVLVLEIKKGTSDSLERTQEEM